MKSHFALQRGHWAAGTCLLLIGILMASLLWTTGPSLPPAGASSSGGGETAGTVAPAQTGSRSAPLQRPDARRAVREAWEKAREAGIYAFATDLTQVVYPVKTLSNGGRPTRRAELHLAGEIDQPARTLRFSLSQTGAAAAGTEAEVRVEGDRAYTRRAGGEWQEIEDFSASFAPDNDPLAFLAGIKNVADCGLQARPGTSVQVACYRFDVDGPTLAAYLRDRLERELAHAGQLPQGVTLEVSSSIRGMTGAGELWVDGRGLPLRLTMHLAFPEESDGSHSEADMQTAFSGFPEMASGPAFFQDPAGWAGAALGLDDPSLPARAAQTGGKGAVFALGLAASALLLVHRRSRRVYVAVVLAVILSMVVVPLLQSERVAASSESRETLSKDVLRLGADGQAVDPAIAQQEEADQQALADLLAPTWDPQQDPWAQPEESAPETEAAGAGNPLGSGLGLTAYAGRTALEPAAAQQSAAERPAASPLLLTGTLASAPVCTQDPTADSDKDGVGDYDECVYGTRPDLPDTDGDDLSDGQELTKLGINPILADTDGDTLTDAQEVAGFEYAGRTWYLDPNNADTNGDGLADSAECMALVKYEAPTEEQIRLECDTDRDGIPNPFDMDNDNDGVPDSVDLSSENVVDSGGLRTGQATEATAFDRAAPFKLSVPGLTGEWPVLVDVQFRPVISAHLGYAMNVLDWPENDVGGQIQHGEDDTFANSDNPGINNPDDTAGANGDMRLIPLLEIVMPGEVGNKLPLKMTTPDATVTVGSGTAVSSTVSLNVSSNPDDTELTFLADADLWIYDGTCAAQGEEIGHFSGGSGTFIGMTVLVLADGNHSAVVDNGSVSACADLPDLVNGPYSDLMVDASVLDPYGISVKEGYGTSDSSLVAYVPLEVVADDTGGGKTAFQARMLHWVGANSSWNEAVQMRVIWIVQMLVDSCANSEEAMTWDEYVEANPGASKEDYSDYIDAYCAANRTVEEVAPVQIYDESWYITGLSVQEAHGLDIAVAYPNPALATYSDDGLWSLAWGLGRQFLTGRDCGTRSTLFAQNPAACAGNKVRDVAVYGTDHLGRPNGDSTIEERFDNNGLYTTHRTRWGIAADALEVKSFKFDHQDYVGKMTTELTPAILEEYTAHGHTDWVPTLLFAYEEHARLGNVISATVTLGVLTLDMSREAHPEDTLAGMKWAPFRHTEDAGWEAFPSLDYWDVQEADLTARFEGIFPADTDAATLGRVSTARSYSVAMIVGVGTPLYCTPEDASCPTAANEVGASDQDLKEAAAEMKGGLSHVSIELVSALMLAKKQYKTGTIAFDEARNALAEELRDNIIAMTQNTLGWADATHPEVTFFEAVGAQELNPVTSLWQSTITGGPVTGIWWGLDVISAEGGLIGWLKASGENQLLFEEIVFYVYQTVKAVIAVGLFVYGVYKLVQNVKSVIFVVTGAMKGFGFAKNFLSGKGGKLSFAIVVVTVVLAWAAFAMSTFGTMAWDQALMGAIATTIVTVVWYILTTFLGPIGSILSSIKMILDMLATTLCSALLTEQEQQKEEWAQWVCGGVTGMLEQFIEALIYSGTLLVDMDPYSSDPWYPRVDMYGLQPTLVQEEDGFVVGNTMRYTIGLTTTIMLVDPPVRWHEVFWAYQFNDENLALANFDYKWQTGENDFHDSLALGGMTWQGTEDGAPFYHTETVGTEQEFPLTKAGINREMEDLYLSEAYAVPEQECWGLLFEKYCYIPAEKGTLHYDMGSSIRQDVLPRTLTEFYQLAEPAGEGQGYALAWEQEGDLRFEILADADGDGLSRLNDPDDSTWDADGDGLSDVYELDNGLDPLSSDHDRDGLSDAQEVRLGTDPWLRDTDGDGLLDCQEVFHEVIVAGDQDAREACGGKGTWSGGWEIVYEPEPGTRSNTVVTSNPLAADSDADGLTDRRELIYGYNPRVYSILKVLSLDSKLSEEGLPVSDGIVAPGQTLAYNATVKNELDNRRAEGLLWTAPSGVLAQSATNPVVPQSFDLWPQEQVPMTGDLVVDGEAASGTYTVTQVAGALISDPKVESGKATLWLPFDDAEGSAVFADESGYGHDGSCVGTSCTLLPAAGRIGGALQLDGTSYVRSEATLANDGFSASFWFKATEDNMYGGFLFVGATGPAILLYEGQILVWDYQGDAAYIDYIPYGYQLTADRWHHVVVTDPGYGGTGNMLLYVDGGLIASGTKTNRSTPNSAGAFIGGHPLYGALEVTMDDVRMFEEVLSPAQVQDLFDTPLFHMDFDGGGWTDVSDSPASFAACTQCPSHPTVGFSGGYAVFDGTQYLHVNGASKLNLNGGRFSLAAWIYPRSRGSNDPRDTHPQGILGLGSGTSSAYPTLQRVGKKIRFSLGTGAGWATPYTSGDVLKENRWNYVVLTLDKEDRGGWLSLYVDGQLVGEQAFTSTPLASAQSFDIGRSSSVGKITISSIWQGLHADFDGESNPRLQIGGVEVWRGDYAGNPTLPIDQARDFTGSTSVTMWEEDSTTSSDTCTFSGNTALVFDTVKPSVGETGYKFDNCGWGYLYVTYDNNSIPFFGDIDELQIFGRPLDPDSVKRRYMDIATVLHLPLDEAPGAEAFQDTSLPYVPASCSGEACPTSGTAGRLNGAAWFDHTEGDNILLSNFGDSSTVSVAAWVYRAADSGTRETVVSYKEGGDPNTTSGCGFVLAVDNDVPKFWVNVGGTWKSIAGTGYPVALNRWAHLAGTYDGTTLRLYYNGDEIGTPVSAPGGMRQCTANTAIGSRNTQNMHFFPGRIDDVWIFDTALPTDRIADLLESAPFMDLRFEEAYGADHFADNADADRFGTCTGDACPATGEAVRGQIGLAARFDGIDDSVTVDSFGDFAKTTVSAWVYRTGATTTRETIVSYKESVSAGFVLDLNDENPNHYPRFWVHVGTSWLPVTDESNPVPLNQWVHLAGTYDGTWIRLYRNGDLKKELMVVGSMSQRAAPIAIGSRNTQDMYFFPGLIDEVRIYGRALTGSQIWDRYLYESAWVENRQSQEITVDNDDPTAEVLLVDGTWLPWLDGVPYVAEITAQDPTSDITAVDFCWRLGDSGQTTCDSPATAAPCPVNAGHPEGAWCADYWLPQPEANAAYHLMARATDSVGNQGGWSDPVHAWTDGGKPEVSLDQASLRVDVHDSADRANSWVIPLSGLAADPPSSGGDDCFTSGVPSDGVHVTLRRAGDPERKALGEVRQAATVTETGGDPNFGGVWSLDYEVPKAAVDGCYEVEVEVVDQIARIPDASGDNALYHTETNIYTIMLDGSAPAVLLNRQPDIAGGLLGPAVEQLNGPTSDRPVAVQVDLTPGTGAAETRAWLTCRQSDTADWYTLFDLPASTMPPGSTQHWQGEIHQGSTCQVKLTTTAPTAEVTGTVTVCDEQMASLSGSFSGSKTVDFVADSASCLAPGCTANLSVAGVQGVDLAFTPVLPGSAFLNEVPLAGEVLHLPFEDIPTAGGGLVLRDVSGHGINGACTNCPMAGQAGPSGNGARFDGVDDHVSVAGPIGVANSSFTAAFWAKRGAAGRYDVAVSQGSTSTNKLLHIGFRSNNLFTCAFYGNDVDTTLAYTDLDWHHWACTYDVATGTRRIYRDGVEVATKPPTGSGPYTGSGTLFVGRYRSYYFNGLLDEVRIFGRALTQAQVMDLYRGSGPLLHLPFEEPSATDGASLPDVSGWGNDGTLETGTSGVGDKAVRGQVGSYALAFDGVDDYASAGSRINLASASFSVAFWAKRDAAGRADMAVSQGTANINNLLHIGFRDNNVFTCAFYYNDLDTPLAYTDTDWHHWTCTYDSSTNLRTIYRDGAMVKQLAASADYQGSGELYVGLYRTSYFRGSLDDLRIYPRALQAAEVVDLVHAGWQAASVLPSGDGGVSSAWQWNVPDGLEGSYQVEMRSQDAAGHVASIDEPSLLWRGEADNMAPRVRLDFIEKGGVYSATLVAEDYHLDATSYASPCPPEDQRITPEYFASPWYLGSTGDSQTPYRLTARCQTTGLGGTDYRICDLLGNCVTCTAGAACRTVAGGAAGAEGLASGESRVQGGDDTAAAGTARAQAAAKRPPADFSITAPEVVTSSQYYEPGTIDVAGWVASRRNPRAGPNALAGVEVAIAGESGPAILCEPAARRPYTVAWTFPWHLGNGSDLPDGVSYTATITATSASGRRQVVERTLIADVVQPTAVLTLSLAANGVPVESGTIIRETAADLALTWTPSSDGSGLSPYLAAWRFEDAYTTTIQTSVHDPDGPREATATAGEAQRVGVGLASRDIYGNTRLQGFGSVLVDGPLTPDFCALSDEADITGSACTLLGTDRRIARRAWSHRWGEQRLYGTWDHQALRLAWTGAHWSGDGDLFVYLDTVPDAGTTTTFTPYPVITGTLVTLPDALVADALVWVQDATTASLLRWDGSQWSFDTSLSSDRFRFDPGRKEGQTDLYLPFGLLGTGAGAPLGLLAMATEEPVEDIGLRLWATLPLANPLNSDRVNIRRVLAPVGNTMALRHAYRWAALDDGVCPNGTNGALAAEQHNDAVLDISIESDPPGAAVSGMSGGLFWVADPGAVLGAMETPDAGFGFLRGNQVPLPDGQVISYSVNYRNEGSHTLEGVSLALSAFGTLQMDGDLLELGDIPPGGEGSVTFQGTVDRSLSTHGLAAVLGQLYAASNGDTPLEWLAAIHRVDRGAPEEMDFDQQEVVVGPGAGRLGGFARDESGVSQVELEITSPSGAVSTLICELPEDSSGGWSCPWDATAANGGVRPADGDTFAVRLRATDGLGYTSDWSAPRTVRVDAQPPSLTLPAELSDVYAGRLVRGNTLRLMGDLLDNWAVGTVTACLDDTCRSADLGSPGESASGWSRWLMAPGAMDYVTVTLTISATDRLGNSLVEPLSLPVVFDNVPPVLSANQLLTRVPVGSAEPVLSGEVTDGGPGAQVSVRMQPPQEGDLARVTARSDGATWWFDLPADLVGQYTLWVDAEDAAGNATTVGPFTVEVTCTDAALTLRGLSVEPVAGSPMSLTLTVVISNGGPVELPAGIPIVVSEGITPTGSVTTTIPLAAGEWEALSLVWAPGGATDYDLGLTAGQELALPDGPLCAAPPTMRFAVSLRDIVLYYGWNLISPLLHPGNTDVEVVQRGIAGSYTAILGYDGGPLAYYPDDPGGSTLTTVDALHGYAVHTSPATDALRFEPAATWRMAGEFLPEDQPLSLASGWNLAGYLPRQPMTVTTALEGIAGQYDAVLGFQHTALSYYPDLDASYNTLSYMQPGFGYWIDAREAVTLPYPITTVTNTVPVTATGIAQLRLWSAAVVEWQAGVQPTYEWANFYGVVSLPDGTPVPTGTVILAVDPQDALCGATAVGEPGQFGLLACYRDDPETEADEGAEPGDTIRLFVSTDGTLPDGEFIGEGIWVAHGSRWLVEPPPPPLPDLAITKEVTPQEALPGAAITYTLVYSNAGDAVAEGVVITDILPTDVLSASFTYWGAPITPTAGSPDYAWQVADLVPGEGGGIVVTGVLSRVLTGTLAITNTAIITTPQEARPEDNLAEAVLQVILPPPPPLPDLAITKEVTPQEALPGAAITYTLVYTNAGDAVAEGVVITDILPTDVLSPSFTYWGAPITSTAGSPDYVWQVADLAPGEGGGIVVTGVLSRVLTGTLAITNTAIITTPQEARPEDNLAEAILHVIWGVASLLLAFLHAAP